MVEGRRNGTPPPSSPGLSCSARRSAGSGCGTARAQGSNRHLGEGQRSRRAAAPPGWPHVPASGFRPDHWAAATSLARRPLVRSASSPTPRPWLRPPLPRFPAGPAKPGPEISGLDVAGAPLRPALGEGGGAGAGGGSGRGGGEAAKPGALGYTGSACPE